jgi:putative membrane protein
LSDKSVSDHLANERTYLAWVRTGIALTSFGVVIAKLRFLFLGVSAASNGAEGSHTGSHSTWLGLAFAGCGLLTILFAVYHYEQTRRAIKMGNYRSLPRPLYVFTGVIVLLGLAAIAYLLSLGRQ